MASYVPNKITTESVITRYRREISSSLHPNVELEMRLPGVKFSMFNDMYESLINNSKKLDILKVELSRTVNFIPVVNKPRDGRNIYHMTKTPILIISYDEKGKKTEVTTVYKESLIPPLRISNDASGMYYTLNLSLEGQLTKDDFTTLSNGIFRIKYRCSFTICIDKDKINLWRIDMTIVSQLDGIKGPEELASTIDKLFTINMQNDPKLFISNTLKSIHDQNLYKYEIETEYVSDHKNADIIRSSDITILSGILSSLVKSEHIDNSKVQNKIFEIAKTLHKAEGVVSKYRTNGGLKHLLPSVLALNQNMYREIFPPAGYFASEKADGVRGIAMHSGGETFILTDKIIPISNSSKNANVDDKPLENNNTIIDGEYVENKDGYIFYAFDAIMINGKNIAGITFAERYGLLQSGVDAMSTRGMNIKLKKFTILTADTLESTFREIYETPRPYKIDGIILTEPYSPYIYTKSYKWKPADENTIDFLVKKAPPSITMKKKGHELYFLFTGINPNLYSSLNFNLCPGYKEIFDENIINSSYFPIQFSPSTNPDAYMYWHPASEESIDGKIVEMLRTENDEWKINRVRVDREKDLESGKYFGNDYRTAELTWINYLDPFDMEKLWNGASEAYFMEKKDSIYKAQTGLINFAKLNRISSLKFAKCVIDIGIGKGQDLYKYFDAEIQQLYAIDQDKAALSELIGRKYNIIKQNTNKSLRPPIIHILAANINDGHEQLLQKLSVFKFEPLSADALICNLAVHYFMKDIAHMQNFISVAFSTVKVGGIVSLMAIIGDHIHKKLISNKIKHNKTWDIIENENKKYSIKRLYLEEELAPAGQKIGVLLPFSRGEYYEEYMVNAEYLIKEFSNRGFVLDSRTPVINNLREYMVRKKGKVGSILTDADIEWVSLYEEIAFKRVS